MMSSQNNHQMNQNMKKKKNQHFKKNLKFVKKIYQKNGSPSRKNLLLRKTEQLVTFVIKKTKILQKQGLKQSFWTKILKI